MKDQQEIDTTDLNSFDAQRDRAIGALVGLAVGDALGTTIEFSPRDTYSPVTDMIGGGPFRLKAGEWTDDTSMALCLADSLIANGGILEPTDLAQRFVRWSIHLAPPRFQYLILHTNFTF